MLHKQKSRMELSEIGLWIGESFRNPKQTAQAFHQLSWPQGVEWIAVPLIALLSVFLNALLLYLAREPFPPELLLFANVIGSPVIIVMVASQLGILLFLGGACFSLGRVFGSEASFQRIILSLVWLQLLGLATQFLTTLLTHLGILGLSYLLSLIFLFWLIWIGLVFMNECWGFGHIGKTIITLLISFIAIAICIGMVLELVGVGDAMRDALQNAGGSNG